MLKNIREFIDSSEFQLILLKNRVNIINYQELLQINREEMVFKSQDQKIIISGEGLVLSKLLDHEVLITGKIMNIEVKDE